VQLKHFHGVAIRSFCEQARKEQSGKREEAYLSDNAKT
jgi:hypothetical protein